MNKQDVYTTKTNPIFLSFAGSRIVYQIFFALALILVAVNSVSASMPFRATTSFVLRQPLLPAEKVGLQPSGLPKESFFGTTQTSLSSKGAVKTYILRVVKQKLNPINWNNLSQKNKVRFAINRRCLLKPVNGFLSSPFGMRIHPKTGRRKFHAGIDLGARKGTPIHAALDGKVVFAGWKHGYGLMLILDHGNRMKTVYAHCSRLLVKKNQIVRRGSRIAKVGRTGVATGCHLHFEVRINGKVRNPRRYLTLK